MGGSGRLEWTLPDSGNGGTCLVARVNLAITVHSLVRARCTERTLQRAPAHQGKYRRNGVRDDVHRCR